MKRILVADDRDDSRYLLRALLEGHGYTVDEARHGAEALAKARQAPPLLLVSDLLMPVMDGYTLLRHWKTDEQLKRIPFVVYTATYTDPKDEQLALDLGADAFIVKPTEPEPFLARIREVLAKEARNELTPARMPEVEEKLLLSEYSEVLIRKLEEKAQQVEQANRALQEDIARREQAENALRDMSLRLLEVEQAERRSINRELHDRIGQNISALTLVLNMLRSQLSQVSLSTVGARLEDAQKLLETTASEVRNIMADLRPPALDDFGLFAALRVYAELISSRLGIPITVTGDEIAPRLAGTTETALFRIVQEALTNIAKHARAGRAEIAVAVASARIIVTVTDDGTGFDPQQTFQQRPHLGTTTMRERAEAIGAILRIESSPGNGTRVVVEVERAGA